MLCATEWPLDMYNAVNFIRNMPIADKKRISLLGISMGGTIILNSLRLVRDIRSAIVTSGVKNGFDWVRNL